MYKRRTYPVTNNKEISYDADEAIEECNKSLDIGTLLKKTIEENQTRKILTILNECTSVTEAKKRINALLEPTPTYEEARQAKSRIEEDPDMPSIKTMRIDDACQRYSLGSYSMRKLADDANAVIHIGRIYLINITKVDAYLDQLAYN